MQSATSCRLRVPLTRNPTGHIAGCLYKPSMPLTYAAADGPTDVGHLPILQSSKYNYASYIELEVAA